MTTTALSRIEFARLAPTYERMRTAIAKCSRVDEVKKIRAWATAAAAYYRMSQDTESEIEAGRIRARAEHRLGEILRDKQASGELADRGKLKSRGRRDLVTLPDEGWAGPPNRVKPSLSRVER